MSAAANTQTVLSALTTLSADDFAAATLDALVAVEIGAKTSNKAELAALAQLEAEYA